MCFVIYNFFTPKEEYQVYNLTSLKLNVRSDYKGALDYMKKYTVYEIEKLTKGKLTKYKLNLAIANGELNAKKVEGKKRGRGIPKFFIYESDLDSYLESLKNKKKKTIKFPFDESIIKKEPVKSPSEPAEDHLKTIEQLKEKIEFLEGTISNTFRSILKEQDREEVKERRKEIILKLASLNIFNIKKKRELLQELNKLC